MSENFAGWVPAEDVADAPVVPGVPSWLPPGVARVVAEGNAREAQAARAEQRAREDRAEVLHDQAVSAFIATQVARGEVVSGMDVANGNVGRTLHDVLFSDEAEVASRVRGDRMAPRGSAENPEILNLEPVTALAVGEAPLQRSRPVPAERPLSPGHGLYGIDRQIEQAQALHSDLVAYMARHRYPEAEAAARAKAERRDPAWERESARRYAAQTGGVISREVETGFVIR